MSSQVVINDSAQFGGKSFAKSRSVSGEGQLIRSPSVPAAKTGSLTARTDANTGTATMDSGHGIVSTDVVDVYWTSAAGVKSLRTGMVATVTVNSVALEGGSGDDLPPTSTALKVMKPVEESIPSIAANGFKFLGLSAPCAAHFSIEDGDSVLLDKIFPRGASSFVWDSDSGETNPMVGETPTKVLLSHGETSAQVLQLGILFD